MPLQDIIQKQHVIDTPSASDLAAEPNRWEERFKFHVLTHVPIANLTDKWDAILRNLHRGNSATGLIHADTGYGKTSTAVSLWNYAEDRDIVTVPPFAWHSIADMLIATHGWVRHRLEARRSDLIPDLEQQYQMLIENSEEDLALRISQAENIPLDYARRAVQSLKANGDLTDSVSANGLISYLRAATSALLKADYKGLLILPDEFELFSNTNPDIAKNFSELKDFIFPIFSEQTLPVGCVVMTYRRTLSDIQLREPYMLSRFNKPEGTLIDLEQVYGKIEADKSFAHELWEKLSIICELADAEQQAIDPDVLFALGQFLSHQRTTQLISGPRSVVATFRRAAIHYTETQQPYSIFDFCEHYISQGIICFNNQETETLKAHTSIMSQPIVGMDEGKQRVVKLLCVCPDGVPDELFQRHGIADADRLSVVKGLLGTHVITKIIGPTLAHYKDDLQAGDALIEILKVLRSDYNPGSPETFRAAVRSVANYILPEILKQSVAASATGWSGLSSVEAEDEADRPLIFESDIEPIFEKQLTGTSLPHYPDRTLTVHVSTENMQEINSLYRESQLFASFILNTQGDNPNSCDVREDGLYFHFNITEAINEQEIPVDINKLGDLFLPEFVTPALLLSMLDFFHRGTTVEQIKTLNQEAQVELLKSRIREQLIGYFFSAQVKEAAVLQQSDLAQVPTGRDFVERALGVLMRKRFASYRAVAVSNQWKRNLATYTQKLKDETSLGVKRGIEPIRTIGSEVPAMFNVAQHTTFTSTLYPDGVWRDLLQVNEMDNHGNTVEEGIAVRNNQKPVALFFKLHNLEQRIVDQLEASQETIEVDRTEVKAIKLHDIFHQEQEIGYLSEEIEELIKVLQARGLADRQSKQGIDYLYLVETEINFAELKSKFERLEALESLASSKGFTFQQPAASFSSVGADFQTIGVEFNEVLKDALRQKLREIEESFNVQCASWLEAERRRLEVKPHEVGPLRLDSPSGLDEENVPLTEFSTVLFQDIRSKVKKAYANLDREVNRLKDKAETNLREKLQSYMSDKSSENAIETAAQLRDFIGVIDTEIQAIRTSRSEAEQLYSFFEKWRNLAGQVQHNRMMMVEVQSVDAVRALTNRLDEEQGQIKRHLADRTKTVQQVLENHEYFANRISEIKDEFDQISIYRKEDFIRFQADIVEQLRKFIDRSEIGEQYNPSDEEGCYRRVREKAVEKIQEFLREKARRSIQAIKGDLMKPIEVFEVRPQVKNDAITLQGGVSELEVQISAIAQELNPDDIEEQLPNLVESVLAMRAESTELVARWEDVQGQLRCEESELSPKAGALLSLIEGNTDKDVTELIIALRQSQNETFSSPAEIIESLEELYQRYWLNIKVSRTTP